MSALSAVMYREGKIRATNALFIFWDVVYPLGYLLVFGVGYVPGSKEGRERYEQLQATAKRASTRLDEYGRKLEQFSNQPPR